MIVWGSASGLTGGTSIAAYGAAPQAGDFDGDGKTDLALFSAQSVGGDDPEGAPAALWKGPISRAGKPAAVLPLLDKSLWWGWYEDDASCATGGGCENGPSSITGPVVSGQDAEIPSVKSIIKGEQASTVFKDTRALATAAAGLVDDMLSGKQPAVNDTKTYNNGVKVVPSILLKPVSVDATNWKPVLVDSGYYKESQVR